jgi:uncharacterized protein
MRYLVDGYNLMYAGGLLGKRLGAEAFRRARKRFLNNLADTLGPLGAHATTVVFDASTAPEEGPSVLLHKGLTVIYAVTTDDADERIEHLIAGHSTPRSLTVVSSDRRIRRAATRRKARSVSADDFWVALDTLKERRGRSSPSPASEPSSNDPPLHHEEREHWLREFQHLDQQPETREALAPDAAMLTDEEIARLEREIEREQR